MSQIETLGILEEIQVLVSDKLQVVSYKWLSRSYLLPSNTAKRLLQEFVEKHGSGLEIVYTLSGWLKSSPPSYHIRLVSGPKLSEAKQDFDDNFSVHVYSVQACLPRDPAALWNAEFVQAEELFKHSSNVENCLSDNRFSGISNSFVKHNIDGLPICATSVQPKSAGISTSNHAHKDFTAPPQPTKIQQTTPKVGVQSTNVVKDVKNESNGIRLHDQVATSSADKENFTGLPTNKKKGQSDKNSSRNGTSLANMWGRASPKSKKAADSDSVPNANVGGQAQSCAQEATEVGISDDDDDVHHVILKRTSNGDSGRKRRVVLDFSDEDEDAVNLASPEPPVGKSCLDLKGNTKPMVSEEHKTNTITERESIPSLKEKSAGASKVVKSKTSSSENQSHISAKDVKIEKSADDPPSSPKRRKVLKTRIDERGREVTEVVWEGDEKEIKKVENTSHANTINRLPAAKKSPAVGSNVTGNAGGRGGNKKAGNAKDPKQGNIMSFFKRA